MLPAGATLTWAFELNVCDPTRREDTLYGNSRVQWAAKNFNWVVYIYMCSREV